MKNDWGSLLKTSSTARTWRVWLGARTSAVFVATLLMWGLVSLQSPTLHLEPPTIQAVRIDQEVNPVIKKPVVAPKPLPSKVPMPQAPKEPINLPNTNAASPDSTPLVKPSVKAPLNSRVQTQTNQTQTVQPNRSQPDTKQTSDTLPIPRVATASSVPLPDTGIGVAPSASQPPPRAAPKLNSRTRALLRAQECARLDVRERPADCPPNDELRRLVEQAQEPKYRPENVEGFSRNELAWRGIPPPCLDNGENSAIKGGKLCIRVGNTPSRVRSVKEICEARGLGGCADAPSQAAVNSALEQVRRNEASTPPK